MELTDILNYEYIEISLNNSSEWYKTEAVKVVENSVYVVLPKGLKNFFVSDDIKCRISDGKSLYVFDSEISEIIFKHPQSLVLFVPGQIKKYYDTSKETRYYTSLIAEIYKLKRMVGYIKDVSIRDMCLRSLGFLEKGDNVTVIVYFNNNHVYFEGRVAKRINCENYREYTIEIETIEPTEYDKFLAMLEILDQQVSMEKARN